MNLLKKSALMLMSTLSLTLVLQACSGNNAEKGGEDSVGATKQSEITVTDATGEVEIPLGAEKIIAPYMEDSLLSLGITPAAQWSSGDSVLNYLQDDLADVPKIEWNLPLEQTLNAEPDLVIFSSLAAMTEGSAEDYKNIAPTYVFKEDEGTDWRKQIEIIGSLTGKEQEAKDVLADYETVASDASSRISEQIGDETVGIVWVIGKKYFVFEENRHAANVLYGDLGLSVPSFISDLGETETSWSPISLESLASLDADHVFLVSKKGEPGLSILEESPVWQGIKAAQNQQVYNIEDPTYWTLSGNIANRKTIQDVLDVFVGN